MGGEALFCFLHIAVEVHTNGRLFSPCRLSPVFFLFPDFFDLSSFEMLEIMGKTFSLLVR